MDQASRSYENDVSATKSSAAHEIRISPPDTATAPLPLFPDPEPEPPIALAWKASKVWLVVGLTAKTAPFEQSPDAWSKNLER